MALILASSSPRRRELLSAAGFVFDVRAAHVDEGRLPGETPDAYVMRVARSKAESVAGKHGRDAVLAADTVVVVEGDVLGKPGDPDEATAMLRRLSGRTHDVLTSVVVLFGERTRTAIERSTVRMIALTAGEIAWYVASGEPRDKAGAYAIQGLASRFVDRVEGSYSNVVGLPVATVYRLLAEVEWPDVTRDRTGRDLGSSSGAAAGNSGAACPATSRGPDGRDPGRS